MTGLALRVPPGVDVGPEARAAARERARAAEAAEVAAIAARHDEWADARRWRRAGLRESDVPACSPEALRSLVGLLTSGTGRNAMLWGPPGTGKTACAKRALRELGPASGTFLRECDMDAQIKASFGGERSYEGLLRAWSEAPVLVLDDMGKAAPDSYRGWMLTAIYSVADARWSARRPTVVTSQLSAHDLAARMASPDARDAVYSRLFGDALLMRFAGTDRRRGA